MIVAHARVDAERQIVRQCIIDLLAAGFALSVNNGGDEDEIRNSTDAAAIEAEMFATDCEHIFTSQINPKTGAYRRNGWVYFVYGNEGWNVMSDYTVNLEQALANANALADKLEPQCR